MMSPPARSTGIKRGGLKLVATGSIWVIVVILLVLEQQQIKPALAKAGVKFYEGPGVFPAQILRDRGFLVEDYHIITKDNYRVKLTRAWNPLIVKPGPERPYGPPPPPCDRGHKNRIPIFFIHGILESATAWVSNSFGAKPRDFSNHSLAYETLNQSMARLGNETSAKSLVTLALNQGHEAWIISRRGFPGSRTMLGNSVTGDIGENAQTFSGPVAAFFGSLLDLSDLPQYPFSVNRKFWNFTYDQQAQMDVPQIVDYILDKTCRKQLSIVGHSAGGALTLMALSLYPEMNQKVQSAILWSPASAMGFGDWSEWIVPFRKIFEKLPGSVPPTFLTEPWQALVGLVCSNKLTQSTICEKFSDIFIGPSKGESPIRSEFASAMVFSSASHEFAQMLQWNIKGGQMHEYDYGSERRNMLRHGHPVAQPYNLSRITLDKVSFWRTATDTLVTPKGVMSTQKLMKVPIREHLVRYPFNHLGFFWHKDAARLVNIPTLREIEQFSERNDAFD